MFRVSELSQQRPLEAVTLAMYQRFQLIDKLRLPVGKLRAFLGVSSFSLKSGHSSTFWYMRDAASQVLKGRASTLACWRRQSRKSSHCGDCCGGQYTQHAVLTNLEDMNHYFDNLVTMI